MADEPLSPQEKRWQAEDDARSLARAEEVKNDKSRLGAAQRKAVEQAEERQEQADALKKVAGKQTTPLPDKPENSIPVQPTSQSAPAPAAPVTFFDNPPARK